MSGGVDSSVAAALLLERGHEVSGVHFDLGAPGPGGQANLAGPAGGSHAADAAAVARRLGIELRVLDLAGRLRPIIDDFAAQYAAGRTPSPCVRCNATVKFACLLELADREGFDAVATGHYARVADGPSGPAIFRAACRAKDQSYFLCAMDRAALGRVTLPLGLVESKDEVRSLAGRLGLAVHDKPDSQELCFAGSRDYVELLAARAPTAMTPGEIVDQAGQVVGRHEGIGHFTIGQRRGLRVAAGVPMYVTAIDPAAGRVTIGPREAVLSGRLVAAQANWQQPVGVEFRAAVQVRHNHVGAAGTVRVIDGGQFEVAFDEPVAAVTPGQVAAVYDGPRLLGGGWIDRAWRGGSA